MDRAPEKAAARNRTKPLLVCFIGIDGAGKSTQAKKLAGWLKEQGREIKYVWNRYEPWLLRPVMKMGRAIFLHKQDMFRDYASYQESKQKALRLPVVPALFQFLYLAEYPFHVFFQVKLPLLRGKDIICDRYFFDVIAGLSADFKLSGGGRDRLLKIFSWMLPRPDIVFLIDVPSEVAYRRKDDIPAEEQVRVKRQIYLDMEKSARINVLDGCQSQETIAEIIRGKTGKLLWK